MTTTKEIIVLVGPPGSGKSTLADKIMNDHWSKGNKTCRISQDDQGKKGHMDLFESALNNQIDVIIIDRMGFSKEQRGRYLNPAVKAGYKTRIIVLHAPYETCFKRAMERENHPTINGKDFEKPHPDYIYINIEMKERQAKAALGTFFKNYERVTDSEADVVERLGWDEAYGKALVVDIDGTIADIAHRRHHVQRTDGQKKNWKAFFDDMVNDKPNEWCRELVDSYYYQDRRTIIFASGRPDNYRKQTEDWLTDILGGKKWRNLFMRRRDDSRQDNIVKEIILEFELKPRFKDMVMIDDRKQVVDMWRSHGYTVLQCDEGDF